MATSTLGKLLSLFENSSGALSVGALARELDVSPGRVDEMVEFWIRKGKIRASSTLTECGSCSTQGNCPFILKIPRTFEFVSDQEEIPEQTRKHACT